MKQTRPVMIVEDSDEDFEITSWALQKAGFTGPLIRCMRAEEALRRWWSPASSASERSDPLPFLVLLDLNLPGMSGIDFLDEVRHREQRPPVPIVILSTSNNPRDIAACYRQGAAGYLCKPLSIEHYVDKLHSLIQYWMQAVTLPPAGVY